jgi:hypothetical protein
MHIQDSTLSSPGGRRLKDDMFLGTRDDSLQYDAGSSFIDNLVCLPLSELTVMKSSTCSLRMFKIHKELYTLERSVGAGVCNIACLLKGVEVAGHLTIFTSHPRFHSSHKHT